MPKRQRMNSRRSRKVFRRGAGRTHPKNSRQANPMRGGWRL